MTLKFLKRFQIPVLILTLIFLVLGSLTFSFADDRSYTLPWANINLTVGDDGTLHVKEVIHYHFFGTYNGVYRDIPLKSGETVENIQVNTSGAYSRYEVQDSKTGKRIKVFLYDDTAMTFPLSDGEVDVIYQYDFLQLVKFYNDVAELHYQPWGEEWEVPVGQVNTTIHLKSENGVKYWINPPYLLGNASWQGSDFTVISKEIPKKEWFEVRMSIPLEQFTSTSGGRQVDQNGTAAIEKVQQDYVNWINFQMIAYSVLPLVMLLSMIYPFFIIYRSWGGRIIHKKSYDGNLPESDPPAIVNAICGLGISKDVGDPGVDGFLATLMDLIRRRYILVDHQNKDTEGSLKLKLNPKKGTDHLKNYEKNVLDFLKGFKRGNTIDIAEMNENLEKTHFQKRYLDWRKNVVKNLSHGKLENIFLEKDNKGLYIYGFTGLLGGLLILAMTLRNPIQTATYSFYAAIPLMLMSIFSLFMTSRSHGQWTDYGKDYREKWMMYKKHIQHPNYDSTSMGLFDEYIVYGTALGVGDNVAHSFSKDSLQEELRNNPLYVFHTSTDYEYLKYALFSFITTYAAMQAYLTAGSGGGGSGGFGGGGVGGAGGGSGGGGGGAF